MTKELKFKSSQPMGADSYYAVVNSAGVMICSCGRELEKMDDTTYKCPGGYPIYRFEDGDFFIDKFRNLMFKEIDHEKD